MNVSLASGSSSTPPQTAPWRTGDLLNVKGNFGGMFDSANRCVYTPNTSGAMVAGVYPEWARLQREAGLTHMLVGDARPGSYPGSPWQNPDLRDPKKLRAFLETILGTPAADGMGFTPMFWFDGGTYPDKSPKQRVDEDWPLILRACVEGDHNLRDYIVPCLGYELITASEWSSNDFSYGLEWQHANGFKRITVHLSPGRSAFSSNPVEPDDWWQGDEAGCYKSHGGEHVEHLFFQIPPPWPGTDLYQPYADNPASPFDRWNDALLRAGGGYHGWRPVRVTFGEAVVALAFHGQCTEDWARQVATAAKWVADNPMASDYHGGPVQIGYGNGLPY